MRLEGKGEVKPTRVCAPRKPPQTVESPPFEQCSPEDFNCYQPQTLVSVGLDSILEPGPARDGDAKPSLPSTDN